MLNIRRSKLKNIFLGILTVLVLASCSTKKNKWNRRVYHNLTSHYNVWWNGDQSVKEGEKALKEAIKDDYTVILPVFNYGTKENALSLNSNMDRAIEKASISIQRHSMRFGGKEYVKWIDDSYLIMAIANFYKQEYIPARRTFDFVTNSYKYNDITLHILLWKLAPLMLKDKILYHLYFLTNQRIKRYFRLLKIQRLFCIQNLQL